jgi:hypothetical protein
MLAWLLSGVGLGSDGARPERDVACLSPLHWIKPIDRLDVRCVLDKLKSQKRTWRRLLLAVLFINSAEGASQRPPAPMKGLGRHLRLSPQAELKGAGHAAKTPRTSRTRGDCGVPFLSGLINIILGAFFPLLFSLSQSLIIRSTQNRVRGPMVTLEYDHRSVAAVKARLFLSIGAKKNHEIVLQADEPQPQAIVGEQEGLFW